MMCHCGAPMLAVDLDRNWFIWRCRKGSHVAWQARRSTKVIWSTRGAVA